VLPARGLLSYSQVGLSEAVRYRWKEGIGGLACGEFCLVIGGIETPWDENIYEDAACDQYKSAYGQLPPEYGAAY